MSKVVEAVESPVFVKRKHELADLYKSLERATPAAVDLLVQTMNNEELSLKERRTAAEKLIDLQVKVAEVVSKDGLLRQVAEIKAKGMIPQLSTAGGTQKKQGPSIDFDNLQEV
jgi:hypothetical protein